MLLARVPRQPDLTIDTVKSKAPDLQIALAKISGDIFNFSRNRGLTWRDVVLSSSGPKGLDRLQEKCERRLNNDPTRLLDSSRVEFRVANPEYGDLIPECLTSRGVDFFDTGWTRKDRGIIERQVFVALEANEGESGIAEIMIKMRPPSEFVEIHAVDRAFYEIIRLMSGPEHSYQRPREVDLGRIRSLHVRLRESYPAASIGVAGFDDCDDRLFLERCTYDSYLRTCFEQHQKALACSHEAWRNLAKVNERTSGVALTKGEQLLEKWARELISGHGRRTLSFGFEGLLVRGVALRVGANLT